MNRVHEPSPNGDSKTVLSRKPGKKLSQLHEHPAGPTGTPKCAQARTGTPRRVHGRHIVVGSLAVSWQGAGRVAGPSGRVAALRARVPLPSARAHQPSAPARAPAAPSCLATIQYFVLQPNSSQTKHLSHDTILYRDTAFPANCLQYNICIATHIQQSLKYNTHCNTLPTHFTLSCNTILSITRYFQPFKPPLQSRYNTCIVIQCSC